MNRFTEYQPSLESYFRAVILFGKNSASYKFAMAKSLLEVGGNGRESFISLQDISVHFAAHICEHLKLSDKQAVSSSSKYLDICRGHNAGTVSYDELIDSTRKLGFVNVLDAFHNVNNDRLPVSFFEVSKSDNTKGIILTDDMYRILQSVQADSFETEVEARWRLVETAWSTGVSSNMLKVRHDESAELLFVEEHDRGRRTNITSSRDALNGYQKGKCFYCFRDISTKSGHPDLADVDHFLPHRLALMFEKNLNGVWNLVLSCQDCNRGSEGKFARIPHIEYLDRLFRRNEFLVESHHPLRETLMNQTGKTRDKRISYLNLMYNLSLSASGGTRWRPTFELPPAF